MDVVIVGHGPSTQGQGWGPRIDACDAVVRMINGGWQEPADYGVRVDYAVAASTARRWSQYAKMEMSPAREWWVYSSPGDWPEGPWPAAHRGAPVVRIDASPWRDAMRAVLKDRVTLTRGGFAVLAVIARLAPARIILVGFDSIFEARYDVREIPENVAEVGKTGIHTYAREWRGLDGRVVHDCDRERDLIVAAAAKASVPLVSAADIWPMEIAA